MSMINCPECNKEISDKAKNCPNCGYEFEEMMFCKFCGEKIPVSSKVCPKCEKQLEERKEDTSQPTIIVNNSANASAYQSQSINANGRLGRPKNKWTAFILCVLLGCFGAHKFYEGKTGMGIVYIFTCGLFGIGWIIDIIMLLLKPNPYYV